MQRPIPIDTPPDFTGGEARRVLLERVAASAVFRKSNRLRQLLLFLGERCLGNPDIHIREYDIGVEVFGRGSGYDTSQDTIVRVQACQLRKRLKEYFEAEGRDEPVVIDLPKGAYTLTFLEREKAVDAEPEPASPIPSFRRPAWMPWALVFLLVGAAVLVTDDLRLRSRAAAGTPPAPATDSFWKQMYTTQLHNYLVLSDANLVVFEDRIGRHISIQEYQDKAFSRLAGHYIEDPEIRALTIDVVGRLYTGLADASMARRISLRCAANGIDPAVIIAREISASQVAAYNTVLFGSRRANPWVNLFEDRLNFRTGFEESPRTAWFTNRNPRPGEQREYRGRFGTFGYCRVAFVPNPKGNGNALLISGTDVPSTDSGGDFVTSETWMRTLREKLNLGPRDPYPYFEVLLGGQVVNNSVPQSQLIAVRRH